MLRLSANVSRLETHSSAHADMGRSDKRAHPLTRAGWLLQSCVRLEPLLTANLAANAVRANPGARVGTERQTRVLEDLTRVGRTALGALRPELGACGTRSRTTDLGAAELTVFTAALVAARRILNARGAAGIHDAAHFAGCARAQRRLLAAPGGGARSGARRCTRRAHGRTGGIGLHPHGGELSEGFRILGVDGRGATAGQVVECNGRALTGLGRITGFGSLENSGVFRAHRRTVIGARAGRAIDGAARLAGASVAPVA